jgi:3-hydroxyacyl-CoA dehydrogenase/enoyl-CoA hydratase/3-hydroxybutyryl-CoA epimerase
MIRYQKDTANIVTLTLDMQGYKENILNHQMWTSFLPVLQRLQSEKEAGKLKGVIFTSAKKTFLSGGDFDRLLEDRSPEEIFANTQELKNFLRELEKPGVPVVAAINGSALGPGFEMALACHYRISINKPEIQLGFPEIRFGLIPGAGGVIRLLWLMGISAAFRILSSGRAYPPGEALRIGLSDQLASDYRDMMEKARQWLNARPDGRRPWDQRPCSIPGGTASEGNNPLFFQHQLSNLQGDRKPSQAAVESILRLLQQGSELEFDTACRLESRFYTANLVKRETKNLLRALHFDRQTLLKGASRPKGFGRFRPRRVGIIGAGKMGSGIALACLRQGMEVVLKDISPLVAEQGRDWVKARLERSLAQGELEEGQQDQILKRIKTTERASEFADCDIIMEAVFEHPGVKRKVTREAEEYLDDFALFGTNTISIPITELARAISRPQQYIGLHFFHPADQVPLVEIVRGDETADETVAKAFDFVKQIGKVPIIVKDDWGFFAARVQNTYLLEGITMLQEGVPAPLIEFSGLSSGMPEGPLHMADRTGLDLVLKYENQAAAHYGKKYIQHPAVSVLQTMLDQYPRAGGSKKAGFFEYDLEGNPTGLWSGLGPLYPPKPGTFREEELADRLLIAQVLEAVWCLQEGVIRNIAEANLGSIFGWGFPAEKGGVIQYILGFGLEDFIEKCHNLQKQFGPRFRVPGKIRKILA